MTPPRVPIRRKLVTAMMLTSGSVMLLTGLVFIGHELLSFRRATIQGLTARASILAANSTAALAFENPDDATQVLSALHADPSMVLAALYDDRDQVFATYPATVRPTALPSLLEREGARFERSHLLVFQPVNEGGRRLGTLVLETDLRNLKQRLKVDVTVVLLALLGSLCVALVISNGLQQRIAQPVLTLATAARRVSEAKDYSVRVRADADDEVGVLTESFNDMLDEIQRRDTALRTNETRLRATLESALDAIITMDSDGRVVEFNPAAERMFGYAREVAIGAPLADLIIPPSMRERHRQGLARHLATGEAVVLGQRMELSAMRCDGELLDVEVSITRIPQPGPPLFTGFIRDISARKRAELEIRQLNADLEQRVAARTAQLEATNRELEAFSYSVSHDLRAPLRAIDGFSKALLEDNAEHLDDAGRRHLERVRSATQHMGRLIDDMLDLARLSRAELHREPVDLSAMAREIAATLQQAEPERRVSFRIQDDVVVSGDSHLLRAALDNLLRNAWKFTSKHEAASIELGCIDRDGEPVYFVRDDGAGFDMAHAKLLFTPFQRLHRRNDFDGTGVGLATVQRIVQRHGGRMWAEGAVERGATFSFTLWERTLHV